MKLQIASDLHHEIASDAPLCGNPLPLARGAEALVLAGDIHAGMGAVGLYRDYAAPVIYVHGDNEQTLATCAQLVAQLRKEAKGTSVHFLENGERIIDRVRFLGAYLRTARPFSLEKHDRSQIPQSRETRRFAIPRSWPRHS
ncbi:hypothetical protein [Paraburkholderia sp. BL6669N2]|uniref:hypothetical protein n=1 Tax=Paraburkholderia sp. BL6669N2 TaxID=1938807 RepID=UPI0011C0181C|nr:hypothetical protein [Paraburkholderia sp. BL6669N2]